MFRKICVLLLYVFFILSVSPSVLSFDDYYDWASGYKFATDPFRTYPDDGSMDYRTSPTQFYFKEKPIVGGEPDPSAGWTNDLMARFSVSQENWSPFASCVDGELQEACSYDGQTITGLVNFTYSCLGTVAYDMDVDIASKSLVGGDTMYGAWSFIFNLLPGYPGEECGKEGRCFVGNAIILDTKAQKEEKVGRLWGMGVKELVEGPGEVFYMDQIRAYTQPITYRGYKLNKPYIVGTPLMGSIPGGVTGTCNGSLFESQLGSREMPAKAKSSYAPTLARLKGEWAANMEAYAAAEEETGIPCEILAGVHWAEGANQPERSLWDGALNLRGGTLTTDAIITAQELTTMFGSTLHTGTLGTFTQDLQGYIVGVTLHNGPGNNNCNSYGVSCTTSSGYIPTDWRLGGKCDTSWWEVPVYWDSMYALSGFTTSHEDMQIIWAWDYGAGSPPVPAGVAVPYVCPDPNYFLDRRDPGAITVAYIIHEAIMNGEL